MATPVVALATLPAYGHIYPLLPLAEALQRAGARVQLTSGPEFLDRVPVPTALGCELSMKDAAMQTVRRWPSVRGQGAQAPVRFGGQPGAAWLPAFFGVVLGEAAYRPLHQLWSEERPDLVVYESMAAGARVAAEDLGIDCVSYEISSLREGAAELPGQLRRGLAQPQLEPWTPLEEPVPGPALCLDPFPDALLEAPRGAADELLVIRPTAFDPEVPDVVLPERRAGRRVVYVTLGTVARNAEVLRGAVREASRLADVVVATGPGSDPAELGELGPGVHAYAMVPQATVLQRCDAVVHHGGSGTVLAAAADGVPQVVMPQGADQFTNARAVEAAGVGVALRSDDRRDGDVADALHQVLDEPTVRAAEQLAHEVAELPGPDEVASRLLERLG